MTESPSLIYLDYGATSWPKPPAVLRAVTAALELGNPGRGEHPVASRSSTLVRRVRGELARFFGEGEPDRVIFTGNATDGLNLAIKGILGGGGHAVITALEHNAVVRPLTGLRERAGVTFDVVPFGPDGRVPPEALARAVQPGRTRLVVINHVSNVLGTIQPVSEMAEAVRAVSDEVLVLVDAAQSSGLLPVGREMLGADLVALTGHKSLHGPPGVGVLLVGPRAAEVLPPWREGGTGDGAEIQPGGLPQRLEAGTANLPGIAGLGAGVAWLQEEGEAGALLARERRQAKILHDGLAGLEGVTLPGPEAPPTGLVPFTAEGWASKDLAGRLAQEGVACRGGLQCAPLVHRQLGTWPEGVVRLSVGAETDEVQVEEALRRIRGVLAG